jgi:Zn-finger nucleic acid-binding protein
MTNQTGHEIQLPCPRCGKRLADLKGHRCSGDIELEFKCPGSCGRVWVTAQYIEKILANDKIMV